jgi:hypothetical protein
MFSGLIRVTVFPPQPVIHGILQCHVIATVVSLQFFFKRPWISSVLGMLYGWIQFKDNGQLWTFLDNLWQETLTSMSYWVQWQFFSFSLHATVGICVTQQEQIWENQALPYVPLCCLYWWIGRMFVKASCLLTSSIQKLHHCSLF